MASELVVNGTFNEDAAGWTLTANGGTAQWDSGNGGQLALGGDGTSTRGTADQSIPTVPGRQYRLTYDVRDAAISAMVGTTQGDTDVLSAVITSGGASESVTFEAQSETSWLRFQRGTAASVGYLDNVSLQIIASAAIKRRGGFIASLGRMMGA